MKSKMKINKVKILKKIIRVQVEKNKYKQLKKRQLKIISKQKK